mmetsp:Transcript_21964/g.54944  ORF Transcript_21964/g.54944 Transcript_21964/m.54944 type:complete len:85 (+) Transcript_21964:2574-2828(+)
MLARPARRVRLSTMVAADETSGGWLYTQLGKLDRRAQQDSCSLFGRRTVCFEPGSVCRLRARLAFVGREGDVTASVRVCWCVRV